MASAHIHVQASLYATVQEVGCAALALTVVRCHTVAHVASAVHSGISDTSAQHRLHVVEFGSIGAPCVCLVHVDAIVVTELVALVNQLACVVWTGCVQVVLHTWVGLRIIAQGIGVDVVEDGTAQHVFQCLIVLVGTLSEHDTRSQVRFLGQLGVQHGRQTQGEVVVVLSLNIVEQILSVLGCLLVGIVQAVPVNLSVLLACLPVVYGVVPVFPGIHVVAALVVAPYIVVG